jgi:hypothetical protein
MYSLLKFNYAREALAYVVKKYNIQELWIPYYLCDVIRHKLFEINCKPKFYHIQDDFMPSISFPTEDYILYPNYFGVCDNNVETLSKIYPKLIIDNAHSFYTTPKGFACFNAEHKFRAKSVGSYLWLKNEQSLCENLYICENEIKSRQEQFLYFFNLYKDINQLNIKLENSYSPFCYPLLLPTEELANKYATKFIKDGKEIFRYWNCLPKTFNEYKFYKRLVSVPLGLYSKNYNS